MYGEPEIAQLLYHIGLYIFLVTLAGEIDNLKNSSV